MLFPTLLLIAFSADVRGCACDPGQPESLSAAACSLSRVALQQPAQPAIFFIQDANPNKPNRWLAIPRANRRNLNEMTAPERAAFWSAAVEKAKALWGEQWGVAVNAEERRSQCQMHAHIGKLLPDSDRSGGIVVKTIEEIPVPENGGGVWIHPEGAGFRVHTGVPAGETLLLR